MNNGCQKYKEIFNIKNKTNWLSQRMPNMPKGEHSRISEKDVRQ